jgi:hypothetical protein
MCILSISISKTKVTVIWVAILAQPFHSAYHIVRTAGEVARLFWVMPWP